MWREMTCERMTGGERMEDEGEGWEKMKLRGGGQVGGLVPVCSATLCVSKSYPETNLHCRQFPRKQ